MNRWVGTVYAAGDPISINHASEVGWRSPGDLFGIQISSNSEYEVISLVPVADDVGIAAKRGKLS